jgi:ATP/maltotriose-dependent transcriptional regulator MalT
MLTAILSEAYLVKGDTERAGELASRALATTMAGGWLVGVGYAERVLARVAFVNGKLDEAETFIRRALGSFITVDARCQVARSHVTLAEVLAGRGNVGAARSELEIARGMFSQMRAPRLLDRTERLARTLGLPLD